MPAHSHLEDAAADTGAAVDIGPLSGLIGYALRRAQLAVLGDLGRCFAEQDIRPTQFAALVVLARNPGLRAGQVALALGMRRANFVPLLDGLEARGLAERGRAKDDRRASALFLTEAGAAMLAGLEPLLAGHEAKFAARLGPDGRCQLMGLLHRIGDAAFDPG
jgi:DNA-binding MarR family transcriptional regulator